jgi:hypothetical protein
MPRIISRGIHLAPQAIKIGQLQMLELETNLRCALLFNDKHYCPYIGVYVISLRSKSERVSW